MRDFVSLSEMVSGLQGKQSSKKRRPIDKNTRDAVWITYIGNKAQGKCYCCKIRPIHITDFQVGHDKAVARGGRIIFLT